MHPSCFKCRFFSPCDDGGTAQRAGDNVDDCIQGLCRINPPTVGRFRGEGLDLEYDYGQWPLVLSGDWCGAFQPSQAAPSEGAAPTRHVCAGCDISCGAEQGCDRAHGRNGGAECQTGQGGQGKARFLPRKRRR